MTWKRVLAVTGIILALGAAEGGLRAQEQPPTEEEKTGFWGDKFALYLEAGLGSGSAEELNSSLVTTSSLNSTNTFELEDMALGSIAVGWKLPADRGSFRIAFNGFAENSYRFEGTGYARYLKNAEAQPQEALPWWHVNIHDGASTTSLIPPTFVDSNGNLLVDPGEIQYFPDAPDLVVTDTVPENTQNRMQTWDFLFLRNFGGKTVSGEYTCGIRYLVYEGNVPAAAWLTVGDPPVPEGGYTDGTTLRFLAMSQETTGIGPTGSLEVQVHLWRNRIVFYGQARFAFLLQDTHVDSGNFFTTVTDGQVQIPASARLDQTVSKSTWNFGGQVGVRANLLPGFHIDLAYNRTSYQDTVLLPYSITIPANPQELFFGTVALYQTQDLELGSVLLTAGFQF
jgi:hypothetical protein